MSEGSEKPRNPVNIMKIKKMHQELKWFMVKRRDFLCWFFLRIYSEIKTKEEN